MFRSHGTDAPREAWRFGEPGTPFYDTIVQYIQLRYRMLPYIYSVAAQVSLNSWTIMRAVALDFPRDLRTHDLTDQYLFGPGLMACPVTKPMYYERNSVPIAGAAKSRPVYLPSGTGWYDFWAETWFSGGATVEAPAPLEVMPVFARSGAIVPMSPVMQYADEVHDAPYEIRVYRGADGVFPLYEDEGDNYNYESGRFSIVMLRWSEIDGELIIAARVGDFDGMVTSRQLHIVFISESGRKSRSVVYDGEEIRVRLAD
jgi:alpha-D-xyloside xylohydrolase